MDRAGGEIGRRLKKILRSKGKNKGSAGTWSDGKLVTKIGRNSDNVMAPTISSQDTPVDETTDDELKGLQGASAGLSNSDKILNDHGDCFLPYSDKPHKHEKICLYFLSICSCNVSDSDTILQSFHLLSVRLTSVDLCRHYYQLWSHTAGGQNLVIGCLLRNLKNKAVGRFNCSTPPNDENYEVLIDEVIDIPMEQLKVLIPTRRLNGQSNT
ncbi:hypothetical protein C5167_032072 [Papaver somniferum]|uniref:Uncharacterized protein n=1 Tax=Papaver somniferum TaxID=3469 RepID=A0A4Y7KAI0_PAPSO|nr:hypothetical protein C5167_032072 [Papaver somniferum]